MGLVVPIAAEPGFFEALADPTETKRWRRRKLHLKLAMLLAAHGCLVFRTPAEFEDFNETLRALPSDLFEVWDHALQHTRMRLCDKRPVPKPLSAVESEQDLRPWAKWAGLAQVSSEVWQRLLEHDADSEPSRVFPFKNPPPPREIEVVRIGELRLNETEALEKAKRLAREQAISSRKSRDDVYIDYLEPLFRHAVRIDITDQFLSDELLRWKPEFGVRGLEWLLHGIDRAAVPIWYRRRGNPGRRLGTEVHILTTLLSPKDAARVAEIVGECVNSVYGENRGGIDVVELHYRQRKDRDIDGRDGNRPEHGRYLAVMHGGIPTSWGRTLERPRTMQATTHLKLEEGLTPFGRYNYHSHWDISYTSPVAQPETHRERWDAVSYEFDECRREREGDRKARPCHRWCRPGVQPALEGPPV